MHKLVVLAAVAALAGCGGSGTGDPPSNSTAAFPVRGAYDTIVTNGVNVSLNGKGSDGSYWDGQFSTSKRQATADTLPPGCGAATILVDMRIVLTDHRGGDHTFQDGATMAYADDYTPVCAILLDGGGWKWQFVQPLPESATISGNLSGIFEGTELTGLVALDPDSSSTAWISWVYDSAGGELLDLFGETSEFRFKIDESGKLLAFQYQRTGLIGDVDISLTMNQD